MALARVFSSVRSGEIKWHPIVRREGIDRAESRAALRIVGRYDWGSLWHAYGPATEVPAQLTALVVGDDATRDEAWWNLWGNIHHQGTIYEATVPAVPVLLALAGWREYPDRCEALMLLRELGAAEGLTVWRYDADGEIVRDRAREHGLFEELREVLAVGSGRLAARWRSEPEAVRRPLLWLLSVVPEVRERHHALVDETLPPEHRQAWELELIGGTEGDVALDALGALEEWVTEPLVEDGQ